MSGRLPTEDGTIGAGPRAGFVDNNFYPNSDPAIIPGAPSIFYESSWKLSRNAQR